MTNGNTVNRHGIPLRGPEPKQCIWPECASTSAGRYAQTRMCTLHASFVHRTFARITGEILQPVVPPPPEPKPVRPAAGVIYFIKTGPHIKIGWTSNLDRRLRSFPPSSELMAVQPGTRADEAALHRKFAVHRTHGREWYPLANELIYHIRRIVAEYGDPPAVAAGAKLVEVPQPRPKQYTSIRPRSGPHVRHVS